MRTLASLAIATSLALGLAGCGDPAPEQQDTGTDVVGETTAPEGGVPVTLPDEPVETVTVPESPSGSATSGSAPPVMSDMPGSPTPTPGAKDPGVAQPTPQ